MYIPEKELMSKGLMNFITDSEGTIKHSIRHRDIPDWSVVAKFPSTVLPVPVAIAKEYFRSTLVASNLYYNAAHQRIDIHFTEVASMNMTKREILSITLGPGWPESFDVGTWDIV